MKKILVSGLLNIETTTKINSFPINYYPIDYTFFGVNTNVSGVAYNVAKALKTLGDDVEVVSMLGNDFQSNYIKSELDKLGISNKYILNKLKQTPNTVVLYDNDGKRQIYCDLKDIQDTSYDFKEEQLMDKDLIIACNINYNRNLIVKAKKLGKIIATDVHVLSDIFDAYNKDFMKYADILFLSDEKLGVEYKEFILSLAHTYHNKIIVLGRGQKGALMYIKEENKFYEFNAIKTGKVINTVGAGDSLFSSFLHFYIHSNHAITSLKKAMIFASNKICYDGASNGFMTEMEVNELYKELL